MFELVYWIECLALLSLVYFQVKQGSARSMILVYVVSFAVLIETILTLKIFPGYEIFLINLVIGVEMFLYMFFYLTLMKVSVNGRIMMFYMGFFLLIWLVDSIFFHSIFSEIQSYVYIAGAAGVLVFILAYMHQDLLKSERADPISKRYFLWISGALFIYLATEIPIMTIFAYMVKNSITISAMPIFKVKFAITMFYYLTFPIALLWVTTE